MKLLYSDIWILLAAYIGTEQKATNISDIIGIADYIEHAIVSHVEMSSAMVRLEDRGYIKIETNPWRISCTKVGVDIVSPAAIHNRDMFEIRTEIELQLGVDPYEWGDPIPHPKNDLVYPSYSVKVHNEAVERYKQK